VPIIFNAIKAVPSTRLPAQLPIKLLERFEEKSNAATAVVLVTFILRISAALFCATESHVFRRFRHPVGFVQADDCRDAKATTAFGMTAEQAVRWHPCDVSAIALANPNNIGAVPFPSCPRRNEISETPSGDILGIVPAILAPQTTATLCIASGKIVEKNLGERSASTST